MQQRFNFSLTELYALPPWEFYMRMDMVMMDLEAAEERSQRKAAM